MSNDQAFGFAGPPQGNALNNDIFLAEQQQARIGTMKMVKVMKVYPGDPMANPPTPTTIDIQPMVDMVDPQGTRQAHGTVYGIPVVRHHYGNVALLADPVINDVGVMMVADRDISSLKSNMGKQSGPGSARRFDFADGVYWGAIWPSQPAQHYIDMRNGNISIKSVGDMTQTTQGTNQDTTTSGTKTIDDGNGDKLVLDHNTQKICVIPADGSTIVYLGGDPAHGGVFDFVSTVGGPSDNVKAHISGPV